MLICESEFSWPTKIRPVASSLSPFLNDSTKAKSGDGNTKRLRLMSKPPKSFSLQNCILFEGETGYCFRGGTKRISCYAGCSFPKVDIWSI